MEKNKRNKIIGLSIGILVVLIIVVSSTYAYWQITRTQETPNDIVAACLNLDLADASAAIDLDSAWPISDEEGKNLTGYTFTVTNNCNEEINYIVGLNRVEESNYLLDSSIKLQLDDNSSHVCSDLSDVEYSDAENTEYTARVSKQVSVETISGNGTNTHTIRIWIDEDAPVTEQSKKFLGQVFITGGQGIEVPQCFTIANNGTILGYDESCGLEVKVPAEINGIQVKTINRVSLTQNDAMLIQATKDDEMTMFLLLRKVEDKQEILDATEESLCGGSDNCTLADMGIIVLDGLEAYNDYDFSQYDTVTFEGVIQYNRADNTIVAYGGDGGYPHKITSLDLSDTIYLETIGNNAFESGFSSDTAVHEKCYLVSSGDAAYYCYGYLKEVVFPQNGVLTEIGEYAFSRSQIKELVIPASVEVIRKCAFDGGDADTNGELNKLIFADSESNPSNLKKIEEYAFVSNNLNKVVLPKSVTEIGERAFADNLNLTEIVIKRTEVDAQTNMTLDKNWNTYDWGSTFIPVTYDPNYTE